MIGCLARSSAVIDCTLPGYLSAGVPKAGSGIEPMTSTGGSRMGSSGSAGRGCADTGATAARSARTARQAGSGTRHGRMTTVDTVVLFYTVDGGPINIRVATIASRMATLARRCRARADPERLRSPMGYDGRHASSDTGLAVRSLVANL